MFPNSIRKSPTENESSHVTWHEMNFPKAQVSNIKTKIGKFLNFINLTPLEVLKYGSPTGTSTPAQIAKQNWKLTGTETAKEGSQVQRSELQNHEVKAIINNVLKDVTNDTFNAEMESSNVSCNKL